MHHTVLGIIIQVQSLLNILDSHHVEKKGLQKAALLTLQALGHFFTVDEQVDLSPTPCHQISCLCLFLDSPAPEDLEVAKLSMRSLQTEADVDSISLERSDQDNSYRCMSSVLDFIQSILLGFLIICLSCQHFMQQTLN